MVLPLQAVNTACQRNSRCDPYGRTGKPNETVLVTSDFWNPLLMATRAIVRL